MTICFCAAISFGTEPRPLQRYLHLPLLNVHQFQSNYLAGFHCYDLGLIADAAYDVAARRDLEHENAGGAGGFLSHEAMILSTLYRYFLPRQARVRFGRLLDQRLGNNPYPYLPFWPKQRAGADQRYQHHRGHDPRWVVYKRRLCMIVKYITELTQLSSHRSLKLNWNG
jgi:hypothetical protein